LDDLQSEIDNLRQKQHRILALAIADQSEKDVLEDQIVKIRRKTCDLRKMVNEVDNEFNEFAKVCESSGEVRIRQNQVDLLRRKLRDLIIRFNDTHADYRSRVSVRVRRHLHAVGENITEEEADKIIDSAGSDEVAEGKFLRRPCSVDHAVREWVVSGVKSPKISTDRFDYRIAGEQEEFLTTGTTRSVNETLKKAILPKRQLRLCCMCIIVWKKKNEKCSRLRNDIAKFVQYLYFANVLLGSYPFGFFRRE
uniref:SynN domain-containing protein n=1 Tax=Angiostrongylus cantonensis TaxID=6313 RepID=A0A0K0D5T5_ANGCA